MHQDLACSASQGAPGCRVGRVVPRSLERATPVSRCDTPGRTPQGRRDPAACRRGQSMERVAVRERRQVLLRSHTIAARTESTVLLPLSPKKCCYCCCCRSSPLLRTVLEVAAVVADEMATIKEAQDASQLFRGSAPVVTDCTNQVRDGSLHHHSPHS